MGGVTHRGRWQRTGSLCSRRSSKRGPNGSTSACGSMCSSNSMRTASEMDDVAPPGCSCTVNGEAKQVMCAHATAVVCPRTSYELGFRNAH